MDILKCLSCGKELKNKKGTQPSYCTECMLEIRYKVEDIDHKQIDEELQKILNFFASDVNAAFNKDPAAHSFIEVLTTYPGIKAVLLYRIAHFFHRIGMPFVPRYLSELARESTGVEIHPGAKIGSDFFIDHGAGVVIGETAEIGDNCTFYAGVVLGGTSLEPVKRHPTLGDNVVVGTGAKLLGPITVGDNARIGANSVVVEDVPPHSVIVGVPAKVTKIKGEDIEKEIDLKHGDIPDPISNKLLEFEDRIKELEGKLSSFNDSEKD
jgi:serine O-acetyltransferase